MYLVNALLCAARDLTRPAILWQALWPPLLAVAFWGTVAFAVWAHGIALISGLLPDFEWAMWAWLSHWAAVFLLLAALSSLAYATALLLVAVVALPRLVALVAARDYPDVMRHGENAFWGSLANTAAAVGIYLAGWFLTLPLLLVPGALLVLPLAWTAWFNQRTFRFDALAEHATRRELKEIVSVERPGCYGAGVASALVAHIPIVNLLAPAYAALVFVHLGLGALRRRRQQRGIDL